MAIGTAAALIGSAVIGGAASAYGASQSKKAANNALQAQNAAAERQLAEQRAARDQALQLQTPFIQGGYGAFDQLLRDYGIQSQGQGGQGSGAPQAPQGPRVDGQAYFDANPDVAANYQRIVQTEGPDSPSLGGARTPAEYGQIHYGAYGQKEGRGPTLPQEPVDPNKVPTDGGPRAGAPQRPMETAAPSFDRPQDMAVPQYARPADMGAPAFKWDPSSLVNDPLYQFRQKESAKSVNAGFGARSMLRSGAAMDALLQRSQEVASQEGNNAFQRALQTYGAQQNAYQYGQNRADTNFSNDRQYGTNLWATQQGRQDQQFADDRSYGTNLWQYGQERGDRNYLSDQNIFDRDRAYDTGRTDTRTGNLFRLAGFGQQGAGAVTSAGQTFANNASNIYGNQADAASQNAYARANANNQMVGGIANAAGNLFGAFNFNGAGGDFGSTSVVPGSGNPFTPPAGFTPFRAPVF